MRSLYAAILFAGLMANGNAYADNYVADESTIVRVTNVCDRAFQSNEIAQLCWDATGSSSKQFGSEGGSADGGDSGDGGDGGAK